MEKDPTGKDPHEPGAKLDAGKVQPRLIFHQMPLALIEVARVGTYGAKKYSERGWREVPDGINRYSDAMLRHYLAEADEELDQESGLLHAAQVAWNALARLELLMRRKQREENSGS
jgi:hypothetical protein